MKKPRMVIGMENMRARSLHGEHLSAFNVAACCAVPYRTQKMYLTTSCFRSLNLETPFSSHYVALLEYSERTVGGTVSVSVRMHNDGNSKRS